MSNITFGYNNRIDLSTTTVTCDEALATLPVANLKTDNIKQVMRVSATSVTINVDFGSPMTVGLLAVIGTNLTENATVQITADNTDIDTPAYDSSETSYDISTLRRLGVKFFSEVNYRFWRIVLEDTSLSYIDIGRLFFGPWFESTHNYGYDFNKRYADGSIFVESKDGERWYTRKPLRLIYNFSIWFTNEEVENSLEPMERYCQTTKSFLTCLDRSTDNDAAKSLWGTFEKPLPTKIATIPSAQQTALTISEQI